MSYLKTIVVLASILISITIVLSLIFIGYGEYKWRTVDLPVINFCDDLKVGLRYEEILTRSNAVNLKPSDKTVNGSGSILFFSSFIHFDSYTCLLEIDNGSLVEIFNPAGKK